MTTTNIDSKRCGGERLTNLEAKFEDIKEMTSLNEKFDRLLQTLGLLWNLDYIPRGNKIS